MIWFAVIIISPYGNMIKQILFQFLISIGNPSIDCHIIMRNFLTLWLLRGRRAAEHAQKELHVYRGEAGKSRVHSIYIDLVQPYPSSCD